MPAVRCLFDGNDVQLLHFVPAGPRADYRLVSFDIMHARANGKVAFASRFAVKNAVELFGIVPKYPCWYPAAEMAQVCAIIAAQPGPPALAYGASMGGYGALRYGRQAGCAASLAFSPQAHIAPDVTGPSDPRYGRFHHPDQHAGMTITADHLCAHNFVVHDPRSALDAFQVSLLPPVTDFAVPHLGHRSVSTIATSALADAAFRQTLAGQAAGFHRLLRQAKKQASSYLAGLGQAALDHRHDRWAHVIAARAVQAYPNDKDALLVLAVSTGRMGDPAQGAAILDRIIAGYPNVIKYRLALVAVWTGAGRTDLAVAALRQALALHDRFDLNLRLIRLLRLDRRWDEARQHLVATARKWPDRQPELDRLALRGAA